MLTKETWPQWPGDPKKGCIHILKSSQVAQDEYQMGKSKVFVKAPESVSSFIRKLVLYQENSGITILNISIFLVVLIRRNKGQKDR